MTHVVNYPLALLYDGACPICALEMDNFRERDKAQNPARKLVFVDIAQPGFDATPYSATLPEMQALIHAVRPDGSLVVGVPALRLAYQAVGLGAWAAPTGWPLLAPVFGWAYSWFARNRYRFSGALMPLIEHVAARRALRRARACADGVCEVSSNRPHPCPRPHTGEGASTEGTSVVFISKEAVKPVDSAQSAINNESRKPLAATRKTLSQMYPERSFL